MCVLYVSVGDVDRTIAEVGSPGREARGQTLSNQTHAQMCDSKGAH